MYFNNVHILFYLLIAVIGLFIGKLVEWMNCRLQEEKNVFTKEILKRKEYKSNFLLPLIVSFIYILLLYVMGINKTFLGNLDLLKYLILTPMLLSVFVIDFKLQIIPNRLNLTIFEFGIIFMFLAGIFNVNIAINMFLGMLAGAGIFFLITLVGGLIAGKEAMGFGDVKLMGALGIFFGLQNIIIITLMSFLIGAIISIILMIFKKKNTEQYIAFGPFIVISTFITMVIPFDILVTTLIFLFSLGTIKI